jgi:hypothetical protein
MIYIILLAIASGVLFRMGGSEDYDTLYRDLGCPLALVLALYIAGVPFVWWAYLLTYLLAYGSMTTYNKWASAWYKKDWKDNVYLPSWIVTGFFYGICIFPMLFIGLGFQEFAIRVAICTVGIAVIRECFSNDKIEEIGSGIILVASVLVI